MKDLEKQFEKEINLLTKASEAMQPSPLFAESSKERLLNQVTKYQEARIHKAKGKKLRRLFITVIALLSLLFTTSAAIPAAYASLPGQTLYPMRKVLENIEVAIQTNAKQKALIRLRHAEARLQATENAPEPIAKVLVTDAETSIDQSVNTAGNGESKTDLIEFRATSDRAQRLQIIKRMRDRFQGRKEIKTEVKNQIRNQGAEVKSNLRLEANPLLDLNLETDLELNSEPRVEEQTQPRPTTEQREPISDVLDLAPRTDTRLENKIDLRL